MGIAEIGVLGGRVGIAALRDLPKAAGWGASLVVSMTEDAEMAGISLDAMPAAGLPWRRFPVPDFGVPGEARAVEWAAIEGEALELLRGGKSVLFQCLGGRGRSGMAALRLMVAAGEAPEAALRRLRTVRPGAVETAAQLEWAMKSGG